MFLLLQVVTVFVVAMVLGHACELPGKMRLSQEQHFAVQRSYDPGFTIGGRTEPLGLRPGIPADCSHAAGSMAFWLTAAAFIALAAMQAICWLLTHPVNNFWLGM